ncbi:MAG TPA: hypothetical protein ENH82_17745 [bacterium]|nr:hypothetical protein [bacterium]
MSKWFEVFILICIIVFEAALALVLNPETFWQRCATLAICVIVLVLIIFFVHIWRTKWKARN